MRRFESNTYDYFDRVVVVTEQDARALKELAPSLPVSVISNGVDADRFSLDGVTGRQANRVLFTGNMQYVPNAQAAEYLACDIMPLVRAACPSARVVIVGRAPLPRVCDLAALEWVDVVGEVPDMRPWLSSGRVFACPMVTGTGIKNKLLEALANGLACVATPLAVQGLDVSHGRELFVAKSRHDFADYVALLLTDERMADNLGRAGEQYVRRAHTWAAVTSQYERLYTEVMQSAQASFNGDSTLGEAASAR